jgi:hypothetical protein
LTATDYPALPATDACVAAAERDRRMLPFTATRLRKLHLYLKKKKATNETSVGTENTIAYNFIFKTCWQTENGDR